MVSATQAAAGSADAVGLGAVTGVLVAGEPEVPGSLVTADPVPPAHPATTSGRTPQVPTRSRRAGRGRVGRGTRRRYVTDPVPDEWRARGPPASAMIVAMASIPVILDVDTGVDDACALLLAGLHPGLDLRAVTCVAGNAPLSDVVRNTLTVLGRVERGDVPVGVGAGRPLLEDPVDARHVHGSDGMADLGLAPPTLSPDPRSALDLLRDTIDEGAASGEPVTVVPLAPMTNLALLARVHPEAFGRIGRVAFMGGGAHVSNATAAAEFNVFHDPEAAAIVLDACAVSDVPVTMYGLDVFYAPMVTDAQVGALRAGGSPAASLAADLVSFHHRRFANDGATIGDAGAVAMLLDPDAVHMQRLPVRVELTGTWTRGRTVVDRRDWSGGLAHDPHGLAPAMVDVALDADGPRIADLWLRTMHGGAPS